MEGHEVAHEDVVREEEHSSDFVRFFVTFVFFVAISF